MTSLPAARDTRAGLVLALVAVGLVTLLVGLRVQRTFLDIRKGREKVDFQVFWASAHTATGRGDLYRANETIGHYPYLYPPFLASVLKPFTYLGYRTGALLWNLGQVVLLGVGFLLLWRLVALLHAPEPALLAAGALLAAVDPLVDNLQWVQVNLAVLALVLGALLALRQGRGAGFGALVAVAAALKVTPLGLFLLVPLLDRRQALRAVAGLVAGLVVCLVIVPGLVSGFGWTLRMDLAFLAQTWSATDPGGIRIRWGDNCANHSLYGALRWLFGACGHKLGRLDPATIGGVFKLAALLVGAGSVLTAGFRSAPGRLALLAAMTLLSLLLVSPIVWIHHWVLVAPALALVITAALAARADGRSPVLPAIAALLLGLAFVGQARLESFFNGFVSVVHLAAWAVIVAACWRPDRPVAGSEVP